MGLAEPSRPGGVIAATFLADHTVDILRELAAHLTTTAGVEVRVEQTRPPSSVSAADHLDGVGLVWACGLLTTDLVDRGSLDADIVAAPVFEGQIAPLYHSVLISRRSSGYASTDDVAGSRLAVNELDSWSGHHALAAHLASQGVSMSLFGSVVVTGAHRRSIEVVAAGDADVAAVDHTVWTHLVRTGDVTGDLVVFERTRDWPAPPFSLSRALDVDVADALRRGLTGIGPGAVTGLSRVVGVDTTAYAVLRRA